MCIQAVQDDYFLSEATSHRRIHSINWFVTQQLIILVETHVDGEKKQNKKCQEC